MPTKRRRTARTAQLSPEAEQWLDSEDARVFFEAPHLYAKRTRAPRPAVHLPEWRPWWAFPDVTLGWLRGTVRPVSTPQPEAVALVKRLESEWKLRALRVVKGGRNDGD